MGGVCGCGCYRLPFWVGVVGHGYSRCNDSAAAVRRSAESWCRLCDYVEVSRLLTHGFLSPIVDII